ncbi:DMP19 family protein [Aquimarina gracilis]|uniref:DMP19 family protein n=1 Tax=Aquimarina gracilis TaxID=874422 RepID=A0ABU5ZSX2_9FLAO|nr:DMP19 family protein [Aquimarina gracilis]MEB3345129.1 DMP19 family protein [Aquimarina gracilis]
MKNPLLIILSLCFVYSNAQEFDLDKVLKIENQNTIVIKIASYLNKKSQYGKKIEKLNSSQKTFLIVENLEREINNGGFIQFYFNSSGDFSQETVKALLEIGAKKTAQIVKKANAAFKNGIVPKNRIERQNELILIEKKAKKNWDQCDSEFYQYHDNLTKLLITYVIKNKTEFKK